MQILIGTAADGVSKFKAYYFDRAVTDEDIIDFAVGESKIPADEWEPYQDAGLQKKPGLSQEQIFRAPNYNGALNLLGRFTVAKSGFTTLLIITLPPATNPDELENFYNSIKLK
jgi:hypothetical protein